MQTASLRMRPLDAPFGAEVLGVQAREIAGASIREQLVDAWRRHSLLLFRHQEIEAGEQVRFAAIFGEIGGYEFAEDGYLYISNVRPGGYTPSGELKFHSDQAMSPLMLQGLMLYGMVVPPPDAGGETLFASAKLAYRALPDALRERIASLRVRHARSRTRVVRITESGDIKASDDAEVRAFERPLALSHPLTGESQLFLSSMYDPHVPQLAPEESDALVAELSAYIERPQVQYRHAWRQGDLIVWDNVALQHARTDWDPKHPRELRRVAFGPVAATDAAV